MRDDFNKCTVFLTRIYEKDSRLYAIYKGKEYLEKYYILFFTERTNSTTVMSLILENVGGEKFNNYQFKSKEMMRKALEYGNEILGE